VDWGPLPTKPRVAVDRASATSKPGSLEELKRQKTPATNSGHLSVSTPPRLLTRPARVPQLVLPLWLQYDRCLKRRANLLELLQQNLFVLYVVV